MSFQTKSLLSVLAGALGVAAHGHVNSIIADGSAYTGYDVTSMPYQSDPPVVVGWANGATDNGFVAPDAFGSADIICHRDSSNAKGHAVVAAGGSVWLQWDTWPESHKGPVLDYLAACGASGCETVDKEALKFFKIAEAGLLDGSSGPGKYASDELIENGNGWLVQIPESIKPGSYVLRHEIIALHSGGDENGAQNYPQCINLEITGSGSDEPEGVLGTELYKADDEGILFNIYTPLEDYPIPGPALIKGASAVKQSKPAATATATPETGNAAPTGSAAAGTSAAAQPTSAAAAPTSADAPAATSADAPIVSATAAASATDAAPVPEATSTEAAQPAQPTKSAGSCKAKRSKKVRRHVRDLKARNVAPIRK